MFSTAASRLLKQLPRWGLSPEKTNELLGVFLSTLVVLLALSLVSFHPADPSFFQQTPDDMKTHNLVGPFGAQVSAFAYQLFGLTALLFPVILGVVAWRRLTGNSQDPIKGRSFGVVVVLLSLPAILQLLIGEVSWRGDQFDAGGVAGVLANDFLIDRLHTGGAFVVLSALLAIGISLAVQSTLGDFIRSGNGHVAGWLQRFQLATAQRSKRRSDPRRKKMEEHAAQSPSARSSSAQPSEQPSPMQPASATATSSPAPDLDLPLRVTPRKGVGAFAIRKVHPEQRAVPVPIPDPNRPAPPRPAPSLRPEPSPRPAPPVLQRRIAEPEIETDDFETDEDLGMVDLGMEDLGSEDFVADDIETEDFPPKAVRKPAPSPRPKLTPPSTRPVPSPRPKLTPPSPRPMPSPPSPRPVPAPPPPLARTPAHTPTRTPTRKVIPRPAPMVEADMSDMSPELPPLDLLTLEKPQDALDESFLQEMADTIQRCCEHFGVKGEVVGYGYGPVITVYEFQPAPGVKVSKIVGLQDDLALALKAESVRIDRMPGRSTLGIEVPNAKRSIIPLGHLMKSSDFVDSESVLTMALGVDIHGTPYYCDLAKMPHLLVAGATGAGKSVGLQSMITSVLYKATKEDVKFIFIDPKRIELGVYANIPHLKTEVVVEPKKAANALRWAVSEMERRYRLLAEIHVRSIAYYNKAARDPNERRRLALREEDSNSESRMDDLEPLPYYVIIIDELADLMMVASSDVETSIARLAQMARAVGIHLIVATQRPSVDVLTGTIKANFPCRLSFATATRHDSRTILDAVGAEKLLGKGDALFVPPGTSRVRRLHGAYVSEKETAKLIRWLKQHGKPDLDPSVVLAPEGEGSSSSEKGGGEDELYDEAARLVVAERQASASFLQRRMRVGFSRAARLVDMMEADGLLGPAQGSKPRDVLVPVDYFSEVDDAHEQY